MQVEAGWGSNAVGVDCEPVARDGDEGRLRQVQLGQVGPPVRAAKVGTRPDPAADNAELRLPRGFLENVHEATEGAELERLEEAQVGVVEVDRGAVAGDLLREVAVI